MSENKTKKLVCFRCGCVVEAAEPPAKCPVCGAPSEGFQDASERPTPPPEEPVQPPKFRVCSQCGYRVEGPYAPERCPMCKAPCTAFN